MFERYGNSQKCSNNCYIKLLWIYYVCRTKLSEILRCEAADQHFVTLLNPNKNRNTDNFVVNWKGTAYNTFKCLSLLSSVPCDIKRSKVHVYLYVSGLSFARTLAFFLISTCLLSVFKLLRFNEYIQLFFVPTQEVTN